MASTKDTKEGNTYESAAALHASGTRYQAARVLVGGNKQPKGKGRSWERHKRPTASSAPAAVELPLPTVKTLEKRPQESKSIRDIQSINTPQHISLYERLLALKKRRYRQHWVDERERHLMPKQHHRHHRQQQQQHRQQQRRLTRS